MIPDHYERDRALDPTRSYIVEAPAGSGKTTLLVQRYLRLLSIVERPEAVVAMTFTRKAAAELRDRVLEALELAGSSDPLDEHSRKNWELARAVLQRDSELGWNLRSDTRRLQIQTIDSLCAMLTRNMPVISNLGGVPQIIENAAEMYRMAARRTLAQLAEGEQDGQALFHRVALHYENDLGRLEGQVARMLERREQWRVIRGREEEGTAGDFCRLLAQAETSLRQVFRERCSVDFTEITRAAITALGEPEQPSDLLYWLDYRIEHLLVDEFQDTSFSQYELIDRLTGQWSAGDNRTLFVVGDPMQSIYRFREAEVGLFLRCWTNRQLGAVALTPLRLIANFRSTPEIVRWAQTTFAPIMAEDDAARGAVQMRPAVATRPETTIEPRLVALIGDKGEEEAAYIVRTVSECRAKGSVAILVRSRTHLTTILPALREAGIPYQAVDIDSLCEEQHVIDMLSLTRAVLHLGDRVAWLSCLRAPWCGMSVGELAAVAEGQSDKHVLELLRGLERPREAVQRTVDALERAVAAVGRLPLRDLVERTWMAVGGPSALQSPGQREDVYTFLELISEFEEGGIIKDFTLLNSRLNLLFAKPVTAENCVQVMTIHSAKGLEFNTVIVPKLAAGARADERDLLVWSERLDEYGRPYLVMAAQPRRGGDDQLYEAVGKESAAQQREEVKRLLYVAATRAKDRLYLLGCAELKKDGSPKKPSDATFLGLLWSQVEGEFTRATAARAWKQSSLFAAAELKRESNILKRLPAGWQQPKLDRSVQWQPELRRAVASARTINYEWVKTTGRHVGTIVHEVLRRVAREGLDVWSADRAATLRPAVLSELKRLGVTVGDQNGAARDIVGAIRRTLTSDRGRWILGPHADSRYEWAIAGRFGDRLITGTIDRCFRDKDGKLWIIDYKTSGHEGADLAGFLEEQHRRYSPQLETYAAVAGRILPGPVHLGLYFPLLDAWREWTATEAPEVAASYTGS